MDDKSIEWARKLWDHYKQKDFSNRVVAGHGDLVRAGANDFYAAVSRSLGELLLPYV